MTVPHAARRLLVALIALAVADLFVPAIRDRLEAARYEHSSNPVRFENSDFFGLGPMVQYLREHPEGRRPRTVFLGNSVWFGYGLDVRDTVPAVYQRLSPGEKVLNVSINTLDLASAYLIAQSIVDSVDTVFVISNTGVVNDVVVPLIPVADVDLQRFRLRPVVSSPLLPIASRWRLYRDSYRIQAALFGTSTRQYLYMHKGEVVRQALARITGRGSGPEFEPAERSSNLPAVMASIPVSTGSSELLASIERTNPLVVDLARVFRDRGKRLVLVQLVDYFPYLPDSLVPAFNAEFSPHAVIALVERPESAKIDTIHFNREGAAAAAQTLRQLADRR